MEARDLTDYKVNLIQENIRRTGAANIRAVRWDALVLDENAVGKADIVIADLPCSWAGSSGQEDGFEIQNDGRDPEKTDKTAERNPLYSPGLCKAGGKAYL